MTSIKRRQNDADLEPPLDITRPFMDDKSRAISVAVGDLVGGGERERDVLGRDRLQQPPGDQRVDEDRADLPARWSVDMICTSVRAVVVAALVALKHGLDRPMGDAKSLINHPASTTHWRLTPADLEQAGITPDMVHPVIGLEHPTT